MKISEIKFNPASSIISVIAFFVLIGILACLAKDGNMPSVILNILGVLFVFFVAVILPVILIMDSLSSRMRSYKTFFLITFFLVLFWILVFAVVDRHPQWGNKYMEIFDKHLFPVIRTLY